MSGKTGRGKGGRGSKGSARPCDSRDRGGNCKGRGRSRARDGPSSSQVCFKCGSNDHRARDCPKMDVGSSNPKKRNLGAYAHGAWTCSNPDNSRDEKCSSDSFQVDPLCDAAKTTMSVKLMLQFWWNLKVSVFWTVVQPPRLVALRALKPCSPRVMNMILQFQRLIRLGGRSFNFGDGASSKATSLSRLAQSEMMLLVTSGPLCHLFVDQQKTTPLMHGYGFSKGTALRHRLWQRPDSIPAMPLCGQHW